MLKEYIEREAAIEAIMSDPPDAHYPSWYIDRIKTLSAADVAPVVHGRRAERMNNALLSSKNLAVYAARFLRRAERGIQLRV